MFDDTTWRHLGELLKDFVINSNGDVAMRTQGRSTVIGNVQDGKTALLLMHYAIKSI